MSSAGTALPYLDADTIFSTVGFAEAVTALEEALEDLEPAAAAERSIVDVAHGQLLLMPAETAGAVGVKLATVAPDNPGRGLPRIQAIYVLVDRQTLTPVALLDGTALTTLRTPALSAVAVKHLALTDAHRLVVFGSGPQAWGHVEAVRAVRPLTEVVVVGRDRTRAEQLATRLETAGLAARPGDPGAVATADVVVCATTAAEPLFDPALLTPEACVVAVGSHEPDRRELAADVLRRATAGVVVETAAVAMREAGDVIMAVDEGALAPEQLIGIEALVRRGRRGGRTPGISVFKSVGMGWQDLVVAQAVLEAHTGERR